MQRDSKSFTLAVDRLIPVLFLWSVADGAAWRRTKAAPVFVWRNLDPKVVGQLLMRSANWFYHRNVLRRSASVKVKMRSGAGDKGGRADVMVRASPIRGVVRLHERDDTTMTLSAEDQGTALVTLNHILEMELAGVVRYTHYSLMVFGFHRIPIVSWLRAQADESLLHAQQAGEMITQLDGHPSLAIGPLLETEKHDIADILRESLAHEGAALALYETLLQQVEGRSIMLEEYARRLIAEEELHTGEVIKMLRQPGMTLTAA